MIDEKKCKDLFQEDVPEVIEPKTEEELKRAEERKKIDLIDDDYIDQ